MSDQIPDRIRFIATHVAAGQAHTDEHDVPAAAARSIVEATLAAIWPQIQQHFAEHPARDA